MLATNSLLARLAASAASLACSISSSARLRSEMSRAMPSKPTGIGALTFRDVARDAQQAPGPPSLADGLQADLHRRAPAVLGDELPFPIGIGLPDRDATGGLADLLPPHGREQTRERQAAGFLARIAQNALPGLVQRGERLFQIQGEDDVVGMLDQIVVALFQRGLALQDDHPSE